MKRKIVVKAFRYKVQTNHPGNVIINQKRQYCKRKSDNIQNEKDMNKQKKLSMAEIVKRFHGSVSVGPEYICTCCSQLWYKSSVIKCNPDLYRMCASDILSLCLTGLKSICDTEWICLLAIQR